MDYPRRWGTGNREKDTHGDAHAAQNYYIWRQMSFQIYSENTPINTKAHMLQPTVLESPCICSWPTQTSLCMDGRNPQLILHSFS